MVHDHECKKLNYISLWLWRNWNFTTCICSCSLRHCFSRFSHSWHADFSGALTSSNGRISLPLHSTSKKEDKPYNPWEKTIIFFLPSERRLHSRSFSYETWRPQIPRPSLRRSLDLRWILHRTRWVKGFYVSHACIQPSTAAVMMCIEENFPNCRVH